MAILLRLLRDLKITSFSTEHEFDTLNYEKREIFKKKLFVYLKKGGWIMYNASPKCEGYFKAGKWRF
jgi:hypothetical protein